MINDVIIQDLKIIPDERGSIMHMIKNKNNDFIFGEIYFSTSYPKVIKGWHEHTKQTQNYAVIRGMIKLVLYDNRENSSTYKKIQEIFIGSKNYKLVTIPPGIINGYKNIGNEEAIVANCSDLPHDDSEMLRYDPFDSFIPYDWNIKNR
tara:strand:- start:42 stop:488 length:447 start_codon:yes stop_codon:yes gene_type:complete